jgi:hypothetical protein
MVAFKLNQYVYVAFGPKVVAKDRPEQRWLANMVAPTKVGEQLLVNVNPVTDHRSGSKERSDREPRPN